MSDSLNIKNVTINIGQDQYSNQNENANIYPNWYSHPITQKIIDHYEEEARRIYKSINQYNI